MPPRARQTLLLAVLLCACSPRKLAVNAIGNGLAKGSSGWSRDEDPELVRDATPFALKTIESLLEESPKNRGLLVAATTGFTSYAYAFVESDADYLEATDRARSKELHARAKKLYLRAQAYGLRGLDVAHPGTRAGLSKNAASALAPMTKADIPLLYWTAAAWAAAISLDKTDANVASDLPIPAAMMKRVQALDDSWGGGAVYDFFIAYDAGLPEGAGGSLARAKQDFEKAIALSKGHRIAPYVSYAESASVAKQDRKEFEKFLKDALAIDPNVDPDNRLPNLISQKRARWLLTRSDDLFIE